MEDDSYDGKIMNGRVIDDNYNISETSDEIKKLIRWHSPDDNWKWPKDFYNISLLTIPKEGGQPTSLQYWKPLTLGMTKKDAEAFYHKKRMRIEREEGKNKTEVKKIQDKRRVNSREENNAFVDGLMNNYNQTFYQRFTERIQAVEKLSKKVKEGLATPKQVRKFSKELMRFTEEREANANKLEGILLGNQIGYHH